MDSMPKGYIAAFQVPRALDIVRRKRTLAHIPSEFGVHAHQAQRWGKSRLEEPPHLFSNRRRKTGEGREKFLPTIRKLFLVLETD